MLQEANVLPVQVFHTETKNPAAQESDGVSSFHRERGWTGFARCADRENLRLPAVSRLPTGSWNVSTAAARAAGVTVVVITHRPSIAAACDRVMLLRGGMIETFGPSGDVLRQPIVDKGVGKGLPVQQNTVVTGSFATTIRTHSVRFGS